MRKKAYEITRDGNVVDDLINVNDAFIRLIDKISILRSLDCYKRASYIVYTMRNVSLNYVEHRKNENARRFLGEDDDVLDSVPDAAATAEEIYITGEENKKLKAEGAYRLTKGKKLKFMKELNRHYYKQQTKKILSGKGKGTESHA